VIISIIKQRNNALTITVPTINLVHALLSSWCVCWCFVAFLLMTYKSRGRTIIEVVVAAALVGFTVGFVAVLCIGNFFRARRAADRQRQQRLSKLGGYVDSPLSPYSKASGSSSEEHQYPLNGKDKPMLPRRRPVEEDLLLFDDSKPAPNIMSV